jgi:hypothetical protein
MDWIPLMLKEIMRKGDAARPMALAAPAVIPFMLCACSELLVPIDAMDAVSSRDHALQFFNF